MAGQASEVCVLPECGGRMEFPGVWQIWGLKNSISHERAIDLPIYECGNPSSEMLNSELRASK